MRARRCWYLDRTQNTTSSKRHPQELPMGRQAQGSLCITRQFRAVNERRSGLTHAEERRNAGTLNFENIIIRTDCEVLTGKCERHIRELVPLRAIDTVLAIESLLCSDFFVAIQRLTSGGGT